MAFNTDQQINTGLFIPTTSAIDIGQFYELDPKSEDFKDFIVKLRQDINNVALALNVKNTAYYLAEQFVPGSQFYNPNASTPLDTRPGFRFVVNVGGFGAGTTTIAHGLTIGNTWKMMMIYGAASDTVGFNYYPFGFAGAAANNLSAFVNATNIVINNSTGITFTDATVILEFVKY